MMRANQIKKELIENRNSFLFSINHTILGYAEAIKMTDKIDAIVEYFKEILPNRRIEPNWQSDPETYDAGTIWIHVYFDASEEQRHEVGRSGSDLRREYREKFPEESRRINPYVMFNEEENNAR